MLTRLERTILNTKGIKVTIDDKNGVISFERNAQTLEYGFKTRLLKASCSDDVLTFTALGTTPEHAMHLGTAISRSNACIKGLIQPFRKDLEIRGTGFKAALKVVDGKSFLVLQLGYSTERVFEVPAIVKVTVPAQTQIVLESVDKVALGLASVKIRGYRKVDAYKGKGIIEKGQVLVLKETKKKK